jgi:hypothetical protein
MIFHSASTIFWKSSGLSILTSALSFSAFSSSSIFRRAIFGLSKHFGYCSKPAYEKVFLKHTPLTMNESDTEPPVIFLIPISLFYKSSSKYNTASTTISEKNSLYLEMILDYNDV